jgi:hypothetical protein
MNKLLLITALFVGFTACQNSKKTEFADKVSLVACQDTKDMITAHANDVIPFVGRMILNLAVKEELQKNTICDCLTPTIRKHLAANFQEAELEQMLIDKPVRSKAIKQALAQNSTEVFNCYEQKGLKGVKLIKDFVNKLLNK